MDSKALQEHARRVALEMAFTDHCWPFGPEYDVFKVGGKIFMLMATAHGRAHVSLKSDPENGIVVNLNTAYLDANNEKDFTAGINALWKRFELGYIYAHN